MAKQAKPTLPSGLDRGDLTYAFTSSPTTAHLASELSSRDGIRPIAASGACRPGCRSAGLPIFHRLQSIKFSTRSSHPNIGRDTRPNGR